MASRAHDPRSPEGFVVRLRRGDDATRLVCATLVLAILVLALRVASIW
jgi:hypothetical protein